jgi:quercetin dioxygenase-like cupin family protein
MVINPGRIPGQASEKRDATFTGDVWADPVLPRTDDVAINTVFFPPRGRTFWHSHESGQILHVIAGSGLVCVDGEAPRVLRPGDVVWSPPGERHWHGGGPESFLTHLAVSLGTSQWEQEVTEDEYGISPVSPASEER